MGWPAVLACRPEVGDSSWATARLRGNGPCGLGQGWRREKERVEGGLVGGEHAGGKKQAGPCRPKGGEGRTEGFLFFQILF